MKTKFQDASEVLKQRDEALDRVNLSLSELQEAQGQASYWNEELIKKDVAYHQACRDLELSKALADRLILTLPEDMREMPSKSAWPDGWKTGDRFLLDGHKVVSLLGMQDDGFAVLDTADADSVVSPGRLKPISEPQAAPWKPGDKMLLDEQETVWLDFSYPSGSWQVRNKPPTEGTYTSFKVEESRLIPHPDRSRKERRCRS
jgi:hypothetical protein